MIVDISWSFSDIDRRINPIIIKIFNDYFEIQPGERVLIASDYPSARDLKFQPINILEVMYKRVFLAKYIYNVAKEHFSENSFEFFAYPAPWVHYAQFSSDMIERFTSADILFALCHFSISHLFTKRQLDLLKRPFRAGISLIDDASTLLPNGPVDIDIEALETEAMTVYAKLVNAKEIRIFSGYGTDLKVIDNKKRIVFESGKINYHGKRANIPAGEVTVQSNLFEGKYVVPAGWITGIHSTLTLLIKNSTIVDIQAKNQEDIVKLKNLMGGDLPYTVRGVSIGLNKNATNPFSVIEREKMLGVANLAVRVKKRHFGPLDLTTFVGHFPAPKISVTADGQELFNQGKFVL